ncbi:OmpA family protein [bacterium]|nr:OmpA family protein [bacterium]
MKGAGETAPIIIKKIKKGGHGHHGGSWKVAYADFVTAMMALFIVLWVLAQQDKAKEAVSLYFTEPNLTPEEIKLRLEHPALPSSKTKMKEPKKDEKYQSFKQEHKKLKELAAKIKARLEGLKWFKSMKGQLLIEVTDEGLRIEFLDAENAPFFDVGSPIPRSVTIQALSEMAVEIRKVPNPVAIEGHTDSRPFQSKNYGNWELSADRANAARRILEAGGVGHIAEVRGMADVKLRDPQHPYSDSNRRVTLIVRHTLDENGEPKGEDEKKPTKVDKPKESEVQEVKIKTSH